MKNENIKKENRKALPKFLLVIVLSALGGGVLGFFSGVAGADGRPEVITAAVERFMTAIVPWGIPVSSLVLLGAAYGLYRKARKLADGWDGEDEDTVDRADTLLNWSLLWTSLAMIFDFFFLAASSMGSDGTFRPLFVVGCFLVSCAVVMVLQQKVVDLTKLMNPEKHGNVYDVKFQKKWLECCDEAEKAQIGQASFKAYKAVSTACPVLWLALMILGYVFDFGLVPVFVVMVIWGVQQVSYTLECIRLSKRK